MCLAFAKVGDNNFNFNDNNNNNSNNGNLERSALETVLENDWAKLETDTVAKTLWALAIADKLNGNERWCRFLVKLWDRAIEGEGKGKGESVDNLKLLMQFYVHAKIETSARNPLQRITPPPKSWNKELPANFAEEFKIKGTEELIRNDQISRVLREKVSERSDGSREMVADGYIHCNNKLTIFNSYRLVRSFRSCFIKNAPRTNFARRSSSSTTTATTSWSTTTTSVQSG